MRRGKKPAGSYKRRMESSDALWMIWSNKWNCWYRANSQGYTADPLQAGLFTRDEASTHYEPERPKSHRTTEPFPISAVRAEASRMVAEAKADLVAAEQRLALICRRGAAHIQGNTHD